MVEHSGEASEQTHDPGRETGTAGHETDDGPPPILGSWNRMYAAVLIFHVLILLFFFLFTRHYS